MHAGHHSGAHARRRHAGVPGPRTAVDAAPGDGLSATRPGLVVVLNGTPRSGKSSIASALQDSSAAVPWLNLGVDALAAATPERLRPGIGLRPGGERPDLEGAVVRLFDALYASVLAVSRAGLGVVVDVGHHDDYSRPLGILATVAASLREWPAYFVGVRCPVDVIMERRDADAGARRYVGRGPGGTVPDVVLRWERAVHDPGLYDLQVDTSSSTPDACARAIMRRVAAGPPTAFAELAARR